MALVEENLPPSEFWPQITRRLPVLQYPAVLNLAQELIGGDIDRHATAIVWRDRRLSYGQLRDRMLDAAGVLHRLGVQAADRVAIHFHNTPDFVAVWLAIQWVGAIGVPIPPGYRRREIAHIVNHSGASALMCSPDLEKNVEIARGDFANSALPVVSHLDAAPGGVPPPPYPTAGHFPALITYISSAAGTLLGVVHSPEELLATADTYARDVLELSPRDVCIGSLSMAWAFGLGALLIFPLRAGASVVLADTVGPPLPAVIAETRATVLFAVPTVYRLLLRQPDLESFDLRSLRRCVSAAEPLPVPVADEWQARTGHEILDGLGTTELAHIVISLRPGASRAGSIGKTVAGYEARIVDDEGREPASGVAGLLAVRGPTGARYWRDAEAQRVAVRDGWTLTGDVCTRDEDGWFVHLGRADDLIVSGGCKISPREVERTLLDHPDVSAARVFGAGDPVRGSVARAEVSLRPGVDPAGAADRLQQYLKRELASYKCPRDINVGSVRL